MPLLHSLQHHCLPFLAERGRVRRGCYSRSRRMRWRGQFGDAGGLQRGGIAFGFLLGFGGGPGGLLRLTAVGVHRLQCGFGGFDVWCGRNCRKRCRGGVRRCDAGSGQCAQVLLHRIDGDGEANASDWPTGPGAFNPGSNHPDYIALFVQQGAAAVARIQRCVRLQVVIPHGGYDTQADGRLQSQLFAQ